MTVSITSMVNVTSFVDTVAAVHNHEISALQVSGAVVNVFLTLSMHAFRGLWRYLNCKSSPVILCWI